MDVPVYNMQGTQVAQMQIDEAIAAAIEKGIRKPAVRLDAIGAVFVSKKNPFE